MAPTCQAAAGHAKVKPSKADLAQGFSKIRFRVKNLGFRIAGYLRSGVCKGFSICPNVAKKALEEMPKIQNQQG